MPEGHSVHRLALAFEELFGGQRLEASSPQVRFAAGAAIIDGLHLVASEAHGKQLFLGFGSASGDDAEHWVRVHLGLYGSWVFAGDEQFTSTHSIGAPRRRVGERERALDDAAAPGAADAKASNGQGARKDPDAPSTIRLRLVGEHGVAELTGPTACEVIRVDEVNAVRARLGPDPLAPDPYAGAPDFIHRVQRRKRSIASLLMDQSIVAGIGNIYRAEALFRAGISPNALGANIPSETLTSLWDDVVFLMADGVRTGRIVTTTTAAAPSSGGRRTVPTTGLSIQETLDLPREDAYYVYQRTGLPCRRCDATIVERRLEARRLFWCPACQSTEFL